MKTTKKSENREIRELTDNDLEKVSGGFTGGDNGMNDLRVGIIGATWLTAAKPLATH